MTTTSREKNTKSCEELYEVQPEWDEAAKQLILKLQQEVQALAAENQRLRKALLAQRAKGPKMSTKLRDALYE
ncbi:hypothetical protein [Paenibacillus pinistramenti]|uniref:hypothetical protein n=1 Tax=Paenibacillus pinistramenti TaxID=1768003 RepID=UPI001396CA95|nr:hypothetical protein [Paenibacillus pinistramenti]